MKKENLKRMNVMINLEHLFGRKISMLVVDDDEVNFITIQKTFASFSNIIVKNVGREALEYVGNHYDEIDIILVEYHLPDMNGFEFLSHMKQLQVSKHIPIILITSDNNSDIETRAFQYEASDFMRKPFIPIALEERISRILQNDFLQNNLQKEVKKQTALAERRLEKSMKLFSETILALAKTIDAKDAYTKGHSERVAVYSKMIAEKLGYGKEMQNEIYNIGLLHDIGKIGVPEAIINKTSRLTDEEYFIIKSHTTIGYDILRLIDEFPKLSIGARHHHERWDGRGYPDKLSEKETPLEARIISVADAYDAMTSRRSYRDVMPQEKVREEIAKGRGTQFDPMFADVMLQLIDADKNYQMHD